MSQADNPEQRAHARLSASGSKRWMACPGSIPYADMLPPELRSGSSKFAQLGTAAHTLGETCVNQGLADSRSYAGWWINQQGDVTKDWRTWYKPKSRRKEPPEGWFQVDDDMMEAVDVYIAVVWKERDRLGPMATVQTERKFDLSWLRPEMFGTNDCNVDLFLEELVVIDYKHGQGVPVEIAYPDKVTGEMKPNSQLMYYLLGAAQLEAFSHERYKLIVVQPRCPHPLGGVRDVTVTKEELFAFRDELAAAADRVREAEDMLVAAKHDEVEFEAWRDEYLCAGDHCSTTFCERLTTCLKFRDKAQELAKADFADEPSVPAIPDDLEVLARNLEWADALTAWAKALAAQAQKLMAAGIPVPRHKLVRGKANRVFSIPEDEVVAAASAIGLARSDLYTTPAPKFISPAQLEKKGKKAKELVQGVYDKALDAWIVAPIAAKGEGKVKVAHETDPREAVPLDAGLDFDDAPDYGQEDD